MSVRVMSWVFNHSASTGIDRLVLLAIADAANDEGCEAWPSMSTIARKAGVDRRTVARSLTRLERIGELRRVPHGGRAGHGGVSNSYQVCLTSPQKQGQSAPRGRAPLGAERPEVGAESPVSRGRAPLYPSLPIQNHPRGDASPVDHPGFAGPRPAAAIEAAKRALGNPDPTGPTPTEASA